MKYQIVPANEAPAEANPTGLDYCLIAIEPEKQETISELNYFGEEFGANSENYLAPTRTNPSKYRGTGSGNTPIASYIQLYRVQGNLTGGFLFHEDIKDIVLNALETRHNINVDLGPALKL